MIMSRAACVPSAVPENATVPEPGLCSTVPEPGLCSTVPEYSTVPSHVYTGMCAQALSQACRARRQACGTAMSSTDSVTANRAWGPIRISPDGRKVSLLHSFRCSRVCAAWLILPYTEKAVSRTLFTSMSWLQQATFGAPRVNLALQLLWVQQHSGCKDRKLGDKHSCCKQVSRRALSCMSSLP